MRGEAGGNSLRRSQNPEQIAAGKFFEVAVAPATANQLGEELREAAHVLEPFGLVGAAIEVAADADVIAAGDAGHVVDVIGDLPQRISRSLPQAAVAAETNDAMNVTFTTPPFFAMRARISSGTLRR